MKNYRGVRNAQLIGVKEGKGTEEDPFDLVEYVLVETKSGQFITYGKVQKLDQDELDSLGSDGC